MRIGVRIDVRKPLKIDLQVKKPRTPWPRVLYVYERVNMFCYFCGIIGHADTHCSLLYDLLDIPRDQFRYGPWMKADTHRPQCYSSQWLRSDVGGFRW